MNWRKISWYWSPETDNNIFESYCYCFCRDKGNVKTEDWRIIQWFSPEKYKILFLIMWTFLISLADLHVSLFLNNKRNVLPLHPLPSSCWANFTLKRCSSGDNISFLQISAIWKCRKCYKQDIWGLESCTGAGCSKSIIGSIINSSPVSSLLSDCSDATNQVEVSLTLWTTLRTSQCLLSNHHCINYYKKIKHSL